MVVESLRPYEIVVPTQDMPHRGHVVEWLLRAVRRHLSMDVAFVSEIVGGHRVFRYVDTDAGAEVIEVGCADPLDDSYCGQVLSGELPELLIDPMAHPVSARMPVTKDLPVGSHVSVPIRFSDGRIYGTFCCFAFDVRAWLNGDHLAAVRMVAELAGECVEAMERAEEDRRVGRRLIEEVLDDPDGIEMVFQPLVDLESMGTVGMEALARFPGRDFGPEWFFTEAARHGLAVDVEIHAVQLALEALDRIPESVRLSVNVSPDTLQDEGFLDAVAHVPRGRLVVEVTEHGVIEDYAETKRAAATLEALGVRLSIDDVGMGFSGLNRILESAPQELKLDAAVIGSVDACAVKQALVEAFCGFGVRAGFDIVAEGIENEHELECLRQLGVKTGQGYHLGTPGPLDAVLSRADRSSSR